MEAALTWSGMVLEIPNCILKGAPGALPPTLGYERKWDLYKQNQERLDENRRWFPERSSFSFNISKSFSLPTSSSPVNTVASVDELVFHLQEHVPILGDRPSTFMEQNHVWQKLQLIFGASTSSFFIPPPSTSVKRLLPLQRVSFHHISLGFHHLMTQIPHSLKSFQTLINSNAAASPTPS